MPSVCTIDLVTKLNFSFDIYQWEDNFVDLHLKVGDFWLKDSSQDITCEVVCVDFCCII